MAQKIGSQPDKSQNQSQIDFEKNFKDLQDKENSDQDYFQNFLQSSSQPNGKSKKQKQQKKTKQIIKSHKPLSKQSQSLKTKKKTSSAQREKQLPPFSDDQKQLDQPDRQPDSSKLTDQNVSVVAQQKIQAESKEIPKQCWILQTYKALTVKNFYEKFGNCLKHYYRIYQKQLSEQTHTGSQIKEKILGKKILTIKDINWFLNRFEPQIKQFWSQINSHDCKRYIEQNGFNKVDIAEDKDKYINQQIYIAQMLEAVDFVFQHIQKDGLMIYSYSALQRKKYKKSLLTKILQTQFSSEPNQQDFKKTFPKPFIRKTSHIKALLEEKVQRNLQNERYLCQKTQQLKRQTLKLYFLSLQEHERSLKKDKLRTYFFDKKATEEWKQNVFENDFVVPIKLFDLIHYELYSELKFNLQEMFRKGSTIKPRQNVQGRTNNGIDHSPQVNKVFEEIDLIICQLQLQSSFPNCQAKQIQQKQEEQHRQQIEQDISSSNVGETEEIATIGQFSYFSETQMHALSLDEDKVLENIIPVDDCLMNVEQDWPNHIFDGQPVSKENMAIQEETDGYATGQQMEEQQHAKYQESVGNIITLPDQQIDISEQILNPNSNSAEFSFNIFLETNSSLFQLSHPLSSDSWEETQSITRTFYFD